LRSNVLRLFLLLSAAFAASAISGCGWGGTPPAPPGSGTGTIAFASATTLTPQSSGSIALTVNRTAGSIGAVSIAYATANGTAAAGTNYTATSGTLNWADGDSTAKTITIPLSTTASFTGTLSFSVNLSAPTGGATLGAISTNTITITAAPIPGTLAFTAFAVSVQQSAGTIALAVTRTGGISGAIGANYSTADGTASAGTHYTATSGSLNWADGDNAAKIINVPIISTTIYSGSVTFTVNLSAPTGGATLGTPSTETVTINATTVPGTLELSASTVSIGQLAGTVALTVNRTVAANGAVGVTYATKNITAAAGTNYTATSGTLSWADGDATAKTINVPFSTIVPFSGGIMFTLTLSAPTGGALLGSPSVETVTIDTAGPYVAYSNYYVLPYTGTPNFKSLGTSLLHVTASIAADSSHTGTSASYILDTGSTGVVMPASELAGYVNGTGTPGSITYSSSGLMLSGYWTNAVISFPNAVNQAGVTTTMTATLPVLAVVTGTCTGSGVNSGNCTGAIPHMLGIGYGRGIDAYSSPAYNPFVNVKEMAAGTMRRGYIFTASGIQLGLTNATVALPPPDGVATSNTFEILLLSRSNAFPGYAYDWVTPPGSFVYAGTATATGTILFDTGLTDMILENAGVAGGTSVPNATAITVNTLISNTGDLSYSFASGDGGPATPSSVTWASYTHGVFVNTGNHFLGTYDYLYDADAGWLGLRPVTR